MVLRNWFGAMLGCVLGAMPAAGRADPATGSALVETLQSGPSRLYQLLASHFAPTRRRHPDWMVEQSPDEFAADGYEGFDAARLVLQEGRRDGADLLTLRQPLGEHGVVRPYAGAGLNHATYYAEQAGRPELLSKRGRRSSLGPAAELGAEFRLAGQVVLNADVRWADFDDGAELLRGEHGPLVADALVFGVSLGWRFR
jgi:hypothetical protein